LSIPLASSANKLASAAEEQPASTSVSPAAAFADQVPDAQYYPPAHQVPAQSNDLRRLFATDPAFKRSIQLQIQKANIYTSQLATRSFFVERYFSLREAQPQKVATVEEAERASLAANSAQHGSRENDGKTTAERVHEAMTAERELIVADLLAVLATLPQRSLEPNGAAITNKIRQVASTILTKGAVSPAAEKHLSEFVELLMRLEHTGNGFGSNGNGFGGNGNGNGSEGTAQAERQGPSDLQRPSVDAAHAAIGSDGEAQQPSIVDQTSIGLQTGSVDDEDEELRAWADWRDHQRRFVEKGGYLGPGADRVSVEGQV
jgi:hypothetical protein